MGRTARPRRAYRPRAIDPDPMGLAMTKVAKLLPQQLAPMQAKLKAALHHFQYGPTTHEDWAVLAGALNAAEELAKRSIANDHAPTFLQGQQVLADVWQRHKTRQSWTLKGRELSALADAIFVHGIQLQHCSQGELSAAYEAVARRSQQAKAGNITKGVLLCGV